MTGRPSDPAREEAEEGRTARAELEVAPPAWEITPGAAPLTPLPTLGGEQEVPRRPPSCELADPLNHQESGTGEEHVIPTPSCLQSLRHFSHSLPHLLGF